MKVEHDEFVGVYDDVFSPMYCDRLIEYFEWCKNNNKIWNRDTAERFKKDTSTALNPGSQTIEEISFVRENLTGLIQEFNTCFWDTCYKDYSETYSTLDDYEAHTVYSYKIQKTLPGGGYHLWHCESAIKSFTRRIGVYILFLNDVEEGGETEFLYLSKRIKPKKGRLVIFPPNFPWTHRGNPPLSGEKYIMTGWIEFT
jgi:hypothetical protein